MALVKGSGEGSMAKQLFVSLGIEANIDALSISSAQKAQFKADALVDLQKLSDTIIQHYIDNAEIKGVATNIGSWVSASNHGQGTSQTGSGSIS
jgi:hypothetical protein